MVSQNTCVTEPEEVLKFWFGQENWATEKMNDLEALFKTQA